MESNDEHFASQHGFEVMKVDNCILLKLGQGNILNIPVCQFLRIYGRFQTRIGEQVTTEYTLHVEFGNKGYREYFYPDDFHLENDDLKRITNFISDKVFQLLQH